MTHPNKRIATSPPPPAKRAKKNNKGALGVFSTQSFVPTPEVEGDFLKFFQELKPQVHQHLNIEMNEKRAIKWYGVVTATLSRTTNEGDTDYITPHFRSKCVIELAKDTIPEHLDTAFAKINTSFEEFTQRGSGWTLEKINKLEMCVATYHPLAATSYFPLPKKIAQKKAVVNIQNVDQKCFTWCLLAHKYPVDWHNKPERISHYTCHEEEIKMGNVPYPVPISKISTLEKLNNIRINVYGYEEEVFPLYVSDREDEECVNLLYLCNSQGVQHYCLIRSMSRLLGDLTHHNGEFFYCPRCLHRCSSQRVLSDHTTYCKTFNPQRIRMPTEEEKFLTFSCEHFQDPLPYIIYADFEAIVKKVDTCSPDPHCSYTHKVNHHEACGYAYVIIDSQGKTYKPAELYRGPNAIQHFLNNVLQDMQELGQKLTTVAPMKMTPEDEEAFKKAKDCYLCGQELKGDKVRDHDHITSRFRGALHSRCNLKYRLQKKIPIVFHNLKHYDAHHIMQELGRYPEYEISVIPSNMEKYISFSLKKKINNIPVTLQFLDSLQFLNASLSKLVEDLTQADFRIIESIKDEFPHGDVKLLLRKGVYPYDYVQSFEMFDKEELPPLSAFRNSLTGEDISPEDYHHAQEVWKNFKIATLGDYHNLYVLTDVLLLADVFQNFRNLCIEHYKIDPAHLMTSPGFSWQACLKWVDQPLELLTDSEMHMLIERGIRGGVSMISKRFSKANVPGTPGYESTLPSQYIMYWDANNLYGWAMSEPLPYGGFEWFPTEGVTADWVLSLDDEGKDGYILEVDLEYPEELHDLHSDYPLAPEKMKINYEDLSPYSKTCLQDQQFTPHQKLIPNLKNKNNYVVYYRNLKFYLKHGLKLTKVHKIISFKQRRWLEPYVSFNTRQRASATSAFRKNFFKLLVNSVYGKTMENIRNRVDVQLVTNKKKGEKLVASPSFKRFQIFDNDLVAVERTKTSLVLNKPLYAGFVILELSKLHMFKFHYEYVKENFKENAQLLFTDTDSLTYEIKTSNIYEYMERDLHLFDTSDYPRDHRLHSDSNKKKIGCFKDELNSKPIFEFVGLRPKMYSILSEHTEKKTAKGIARQVIKNKLKHQDYKRCLQEHRSRRVMQSRIQCEDHHLFTVQQNKKGLCGFDDKRWILPDGHHTLAHGHFRTAIPNG